MKLVWWIIDEFFDIISWSEQDYKENRGSNSKGHLKCWLCWQAIPDEPTFNWIVNFYSERIKLPRPLKKNARVFSSPASFQNILQLCWFTMRLLIFIKILLQRALSIKHNSPICCVNRLKKYFCLNLQMQLPTGSPCFKSRFRLKIKKILPRRT